MPYRYFALFNIAGAISWICSITLLGYTFGNVVRAWDRYIFIGSIVLLPIPILIALSQAYRIRRARSRFLARRQAERHAAEAAGIVSPAPSLRGE